jgi:transposase InsO family protein
MGPRCGCRWSVRDEIPRRQYRAVRAKGELRIAIITWIERTYRHRRRQAALGRLTPTEYETMVHPAIAQAA